MYDQKRVEGFEPPVFVADTNTIDTDKVYTAPGVTCRGDTDWD